MASNTGDTVIATMQEPAQFRSMADIRINELGQKIQLLADAIMQLRLSIENIKRHFELKPHAFDDSAESFTMIGRCTKCGFTRDEVEDNVVSPFCQLLDKLPTARHG